MTGSCGLDTKPSSQERVRLLQPILPRPQKRWWPATYSRFLVNVAGSEIRILSYPGSPPITDDSWDSHSKGWYINTRSYLLGCPCLPELLRDAWMLLSPLCDSCCHLSITVPRNETRWLGDSRLLAKLTLSPNNLSGWGGGSCAMSKPPLTGPEWASPWDSWV